MTVPKVMFNNNKTGHKCKNCGYYYCAERFAIVKESCFILKFSNRKPLARLGSQTIKQV